MPSYQPEGSVYIGVVPFDNSYRHTMMFASRTAQAQFMRSCCNQAFDKNTYSYVRMNNSIRVDFNAERLYNYNYVMYQNSNYGQKWFYAFIVGVNYINENVTELVLELDVIQTYWFDLTLTQCMVEREHVNDDRKWANLNAEPEFDFLQVSENRYSDGDLVDQMIACVSTNGIPVNEQNPVLQLVNPSAVKSVGGGTYDNVYAGCMYFASQSYHTDLPWSEGEESVGAFINALADAGGADCVSGVFMFPIKFAPNLVNYSDWVKCAVSPQTSPKSINHYINVPTSVDGYIPRNNKLFNFPYCYCLFDDNNGHRAEYRWEFWESVSEEDDGENKEGFKYSVSLPFAPQSTVYITPQHYNNIENNVTEGFTFPYYVSCTYAYNNYDNWLGQNSLSMAFQVANTAIALAPVGKGIGAAAKVYGAARAGNLATRYPNIKSPFHTEPMRGRELRAEMADAFDKEQNPQMLADAAGSAAGLASEVYKQSKTPATIRGTATENSLMSLGYLTYNYCTMSIRSEFAKMLDDFFDMYGYSVERVKVPNVTGRRNWNYVKCQNSCHKGNMPANFLDQINDIFDAGITFWHTSDVGNYSLDNSIV